MDNPAALASLNSSTCSSLVRRIVTRAERFTAGSSGGRPILLFSSFGFIPTIILYVFAKVKPEAC